MPVTDPLFHFLRTILSLLTRVAWLAFLMPNSRNLALVKVVWHDKILLGMYLIVWHILFLEWLWRKESAVWHFLGFEVNDNEGSLSMVLRIGYCYV